MTTTIIGIRWPTSIDVANKREVYPYIEHNVNESDIRSTIERMLFDQTHFGRLYFSPIFQFHRGEFRQCLLRYKDILYVCEPLNDTNTFSKAPVEYHPYMSYLT